MAASLRFVPVHSAEQLATVAGLAHEIWYEYYVPLIGRAQVDYMVQRLQSVPAMCSQIAEGYEYFLIHRAAGAELGAPVGYLAVQARLEENALFLSKVYLLASMRGQGAGRTALEFVESVARDHHCGRVYLTVNKGNPARYAYERLGYSRVADIVIDIGGGFVMDDYRMEKILT